MIISWNRLKEVLTLQAYKDFYQWMTGQTCVEEGVYEHDFLRWLKKLPIID